MDPFLTKQNQAVDITAFNGSVAHGHARVNNYTAVPALVLRAHECVPRCNNRCLLLDTGCFPCFLGINSTAANSPPPPTHPPNFPLAKSRKGKCWVR